MKANFYQSVFQNLKVTNNIIIAAIVVGKYAQIYFFQIVPDFAIKNCNPIVLSKHNRQTIKELPNYPYLESTSFKVHKIPHHKLCNFFYQNKNDRNKLTALKRF